MKNSKTKQITAFIVTGFVLMASACNTIQGAGQDIESAGEAIEEAAE
mgnify:FL=1